jgi:hypothetical protein
MRSINGNSCRVIASIALPRKIGDVSSQIFERPRATKLHGIKYIFIPPRQATWVQSKLHVPRQRGHSIDPTCWPKIRPQYLHQFAHTCPIQRGGWLYCVFVGSSSCRRSALPCGCTPGTTSAASLASHFLSRNTNPSSSKRPIAPNT